jgi:peroxiredoxin
MSTWSKTLAAAALGVLLSSGAALADVKAGDEAPAFSLKDLNGKPAALADFKGKVVFLDFWATWCPYCVEALPHTQDLSDGEAAQKGELVVLGLGGYNEDDGTLRRYMKANGYTFRTLFDAQNKVQKSYGVSGYPTFFVIGRDGKVAWTGAGWAEQQGKVIEKAIKNALAGTSAGNAAPKVGSPAPNFTLKDLDGQPAALSQFKGKVVFLDFWATWCPPCKMSLPHTQATSQRDEAKKGDLVVLGIAGFNEGADKIRPFMKENSYTFRTLLDNHGNEVAQDYQVQGIPTFVVVGRDGKVTYIASGYGDQTAAQIDKAIADALAKPAP